MRISVKTRVEFPVRPAEQFVVRDGDGRGVEFWRHVKTDERKTVAFHTYDVDGYQNAEHV